MTDLQALSDAARAVVDSAERDENFEGEYIDWIVPDVAMGFLEYARLATPDKKQP